MKRTLEPSLYIVEDDEETRRSLEWLFRHSSIPTKTYESAQPFLDNYCTGDCGCLILDLNLPGMSGLDLAQKMRQRHIELPIIILTGTADVPTAVEAMKAGAMDFVPKPFRGRQLVNLVKQAIDKDLARCRRGGALVGYAPLAKLTRRERQVMELLMAGMSNKEVAFELSIGVRTVETHRAELMRKLGVRSVVELLRRCLDLGQAEDVRRRETKRFGS